MIMIIIDYYFVFFGTFSFVFFDVFLLLSLVFFL